MGNNFLVFDIFFLLVTFLLSVDVLLSLEKVYKPFLDNYACLLLSGGVVALHYFAVSAVHFVPFLVYLLIQIRCQLNVNFLIFANTFD